MSNTYYTILQIPPTATTEEIKTAYHRLARLEHPDKNIGAPEYAREKFINITEAYEILKEPELRRVYDIGISQRLRSEAWSVSHQPVYYSSGNTTVKDYPSPENPRAEERERRGREAIATEERRTQEKEIWRKGDRPGKRRERETRHEQEQPSRKGAKETERRKEAKRRQIDLEKKLRPFGWILGYPTKPLTNQHKSPKSYLEGGRGLNMRGGGMEEAYNAKTKRKPVIYVTRVYQDHEIQLRC